MVDERRAKGLRWAAGSVAVVVLLLAPLAVALTSRAGDHTAAGATVTVLDLTADRLDDLPAVPLPERVALVVVLLVALVAPVVAVVRRYDAPRGPWVRGPPSDLAS